MSSKSSGLLLLCAGVLLALAALTADSLGIGAYPGIGQKQIAGAVVGVCLAAAGMFRLRQ